MAFLGNDTMRTSFTQQCVPPATVNEKKFNLRTAHLVKLCFQLFQQRNLTGFSSSPAVICAGLKTT